MRLDEMLMPNVANPDRLAVGMLHLELRRDAKRLDDSFSWVGWSALAVSHTRVL